MADKLLEAIGLEPDAEIVAIMVDSLCKVSLHLFRRKDRKRTQTQLTEMQLTLWSKSGGVIFSN